MALTRMPLLRSLVLMFTLLCTSKVRAQTVSLDTGAPAGTGAHASGVTFDVEAINDLVVDSLDVENWQLSFPENAEIWTTIDGGSSLGREQDPSAWKLLTNPSIALPPFLPGDITFGVWYPLPASLDVFIAAGTARGFYVTMGTPGAFIAIGSTTPNTIHASNSDMILRSGFRVTDFSRTSPEMPSLRVHYVPNGSYPVDIRAHRIISPPHDSLNCDQGSNLANVQAEFLNLGTSAILAGTVVPVSLTVDGAHIADEFAVLNSTIPVGGSFTHSFSASANISAIGEHVIEVSHSFIGDGDSGDDTVTKRTNSGGDLRVNSFPFVEDFEGRTAVNTLTPPQGWTHEFGDPLNPWAEWQFAKHRWQANLTRPDKDHTTGISGVGTFVHTNDVGAFPNVGLRSPCIDLSGADSPRMSFWLYSDKRATPANELHIDVLNMTTGLKTVDVVPMFGDIGPQWVRQEVDLSAFSGELIRVIFRATTNYPPFNSQSLDAHEFAIDDIAVFDFEPSLGQAEKPGFASFRIGTPLNSSFETVESGANGPFFESVKANEFMLMEFSGEPNQPVLLIGGVLNPRAATFPIIGSLDLGGPIDPTTGIPSGLVVLADGDLSHGAHPLFNTGLTGDGEFGIVIPNLPPGPFVSMQCAIRTTGANGSYVALSDEISLTIE